MFTGIIKDIGEVISLEKNENFYARIKTSFDLSQIKNGDSICCCGVCLTVIKKDKTSFYVDISKETLKRSNLKNLQINSKINLEKSLKIGDSIDGHFVTGHVDSVGKILEIKPFGKSTKIKIKIPEKLSKFMAEKGSVAVDGVSLTINENGKNYFSVVILDYTLNATSFKSLKKNDLVNLEIDPIARYAERILSYKTKK